MFKNKSAWFSDSVKKDTVRFWESHGGVITDWKTAEYLFSEDATCPDTNRIHVSDEYVTDRATVFHSAYLSTCKLRQSTKSVPLGHYLLPPVSVQKEVKARFGRFIWERDEILGVGISHGNTSTEQILIVQPDAKGSQSKREKKSEASLRQEKCMDTSSSTDEAVCCEAQLYPVNNMVSGYVHIDQLSKFSGELQDFLPSRSGYSVSRSRRRRFSYHYKDGH
ncbi:telomere repeats-binding bouquet formation protein 2 isoform 1-T1 [Clarias gariepinus]